MRRARWRATWTVAVACAVLAGCGTRNVSFDDTATIPPPTFAPVPASPADSPQLDAIVLRDTAGLDADAEESADPTLVAKALAALAAARPDVTHISDLYFDDENVWFGVPDPTQPNREASGYYRDGEVTFSEPSYSTDIGYPLSAVRPDAIVALVEGLRARFPDLEVYMPRLDIALSYDLPLSWRMDLVDARGDVATLWADLDGTVIAVEAD